METKAVRRFARAFGCTLVLGALALGGCEGPEQDDFRYEGGASPDPGGIVTGSVAYVGPKPTCEYAGGQPTRVIGRVILTMFLYDNPSPPEGRATSALNLLAISGDKLFPLTDCLPENGRADLTKDIINRSVEFRWTGIPLAATAASYQIRGFFDYDEDMIPFFGVTRLPTQGDIAGGAVRDITNPAKGFQPVDFPSRTDAPKGFVRANILVGLNQYVWTERSAFELNANRALNAEWAVPVASVGGNVDQAQTLRNVHALTCATGEKDPEDEDAFVEDCGLSLNLLPTSQGAKLEAANVQIRLNDPVSFAFYTEPVNVRTIRKGPDKDTPLPDVLLPDYDPDTRVGIPDPHPVLGTTTSLGIDWYQPMVLIQRTPFVPEYDGGDPEKAAQLDALRRVEALAGIPGVAMVGTPLLDDIGAQDNPATTADESIPRTFAFTKQMDIAVPPVAVVDLDPTNSLCRVPYIPFGDETREFGITAPYQGRTTTRSYESRLTDCQDLPTGVFAVNALSGVAGGVLRPTEAGEMSENDLKVTGDARFSGQAWSLPNELGNPAQVNDPDNPGQNNVIPSQGWDRLFIVHDPNPTPSNECTELTTLETVVGAENFGGFDNIDLAGVCAPNQVQIVEDDRGVDGAACLPHSCCEAVAHLCNVPLCEVVKLSRKEGLNKATGNEPFYNVRLGPTSVTPTEITYEKITDAGEKSTVTQLRQVPNCMPFALPSQCKSFCDSLK